MDSDAGSILDIVIACRRLKRSRGPVKGDLDGDEHSSTPSSTPLRSSAKRLAGSHFESRQGHAEFHGEISSALVTGSFMATIKVKL